MGINWLFRRLDVYPNGYYNYKKHRKSTKKKGKASVLKKIEIIYHETEGKPGYRMMKTLLENKGIYLSVQTVRRYMNVELGLKSVTRKRKHHYYKGFEPYKLFDNVLNQDFNASARNQKWCTDFTYMYLADCKKRYNCSIIDLYDRRIVASVNSNKINAQLAIDTLTKAIESCGGETGMLLHSDRGSQYTSKAFIEFCENHGVIQSMSKPGYPYDNAIMERYFNTLKAEYLNLHEFNDEAALYAGVNGYAYGWYNNLRPHSYNNNLPPAKVAKSIPRHYNFA